MAVSGGIGQFSGNVPLIGHNIQKNSINASLRGCIPDNVVRSCVMQFGTKGLFGKARLRSVQHDRDNGVRKMYRARKSSRCKPMPRRQTEGPRLARNAPKSEYVPMERILVFSPPPLPFPLPSFSTSSSPSVDSQPVALPALGFNGTLPVSTNSSNRSSSLASLSNRPGGAYPMWRNLLTGVFSYHDLAMASPPQYHTHSNQDHTSHSTTSTTPMSTSRAHIADAPSTTELVDKFTTASTLVRQVNYQMCVATGVEQALSTPIRTEPIVDQHINTMKNLHMHDQPLHHGTPCPTSNAPRCMPDPQFVPFAASGPAGSRNRGQVPSPSNHFAGRVALTGLESNGTTYQGYMSLDPRYATLVLTAAKLRGDARHAAQLVGSRQIVDVSATVPAFIGEVNLQSHPPTNTRIVEGLLPTYGLPQSQAPPYPALDASRAASRSSYPLAAFVDPESPSDPVPSPFNHFAGPSVAHTWYGSQMTMDPSPYAGEVSTPIAPYAPKPVPALAHRDTSYVPDFTPLDGGYTASLQSSERHECERSVTPPRIAYPPFNISKSSSMMPSSSLANALGNDVTQPSWVPYPGVDGAVPSAQLAGTFGSINRSMRAREIIWQMIPDPGFAPVASQAVDDLSRGRPGPDTNASCQCAQCIASEVSHAQGLERCFDAYSLSWSPTIPRSGNTYLVTAGSQWDDGAYPNASPALLHPRPRFLPPEVNRAQSANHPYTPYGLRQ